MVALVAAAARHWREDDGENLISQEGSRRAFINVFERIALFLFLSGVLRAVFRKFSLENKWRG